MKKIISVLLLVFALGLVGCKNHQRAEYVEKCKEEFVFDYEEEIIYVDVKTNKTYLVGQMPDIYIIEIYGEKTFATYICNNGEVWNYENQSN